MRIDKCPDRLEISGFGELAAELTLDCGQAFRWSRAGDGSFNGVVRGSELSVRVDDGVLVVRDPRGGLPSLSAELIADYFDLGYDYASAMDRLRLDANVDRAYLRFGQLRVLRQEPWEAFCSFIISQCNNITRIKGIISSLCDNFGELLPGGNHSFPDPGTLARLDPAELGVIRAGYRAEYIADAARRVSSGVIDLAALRCPDGGDPDGAAASARETLMSVRGVGRKVADCTLLFGLGYRDVFPVDRHIKRAVDALYPDGLPVCFRGDGGLAQQYLFLSALSDK